MSVSSVERPQERPGTGAPSEDPSQQILQLSFGYVLSSALWVAAELGVADLFDGNPTPVKSLAAKTRTNEDALYRVLRLLAMTGVFAETKPRQFSLTPAAELLRSDAPKSMRDTVIWIADPFHFEIASNLLSSVRTGQPTVEIVKGKPAFEYFAHDAVENTRFNRAMTNLSAMAIAAALEVYDFSCFSTIVDVAGGHGFLICEVLRKCPQLKGVLFDLDHVIEGAKGPIGNLGLTERCRTVSGDFFKGVPQGGDVYVMKSIIHDWDDERAMIILGHCRRAMEGKSNAKLVLLEMIVPPDDRPHPVKILDIEMLFFPGGRERTEPEYRDLLARTGFRLTQVMATKSPFCVIEAEPA